MNHTGNPDGHGWHRRFKKQGLRFTEPRRLILDILSATTEHLSAEDIFMAVHKIYSGIGLTTIYRNLELLEDMGLVHKFQFGDGRSRYEMSISPKKPGHHHHLICINCKRIIDYDDFIDEELELLKKVEAALTEKYRFKILNHRMEFYGLCKNCQTE